MDSIQIDTTAFFTPVDSLAPADSPVRSIHNTFQLQFAAALALQAWLVAGIAPNLSRGN